MAYAAITLAQLLTRLKARWEGVPFWTDDEATIYLNEGLQFWNALTSRWKRRVTVNTTQNTYEVSLPSTMVYRMRLAFNGYPLSPTSMDDLNNGQPHWRSENTISGGSVPTRPTLWAPVSLTLIYLWPMDAIGNNALVIDGVSDTPVLVSAGDFVDLAEADVNLLLGYALHAAALKKGGPWFAATQPYLQAFLRAAGEENSLITTSQMFRQAAGLEKDSLKALKGAPSSVAQLVGGGQ